jgi:photosystem II stability/assembly factor-like uncharacterized protein
MKRLLITFFLTHLLALPYVTVAYEVSTHQQLSEEAVTKSVLMIDGPTLADLGLKPLSDINRAENETFPNYRGDLHDIIDLLRDGSAFEDNDIRATNHFFNPLTGEALKILSVTVGAPSPDWALEDKGNHSGQEDSFKDTRQSFFEALTARTLEERNTKWGRTFQGLGQVTHHLQDMAQPEHARIDPHLKYTPEGFRVNAPGEDPSLYEKYSAKKLSICDPPPSTPADPNPPSPCAPYDPVRFDTARQFWVTKEDGPDRGTGQGIAEFTNNNFVSKDTNFINEISPALVEPDPRFPSPNGAAARIEVREFQELSLAPIETSYPVEPSPLAGKLYFIGTPVYDAYTGTAEFNDRTSTYSIYDADLKQYNLTYDCNPQGTSTCRSNALFTLNRFNFDAAHQFLIKRAVAYSAGLINYFFRGKINMVPDSNNPGQHILKNEGTETLKGTFTLYYDDANGNRYPAVPDSSNQNKATEWPTPTEGLAAQQTMPLPSFPPPTNPPPAKEGEYMLVFTGTMGEEQPVNGSVGAVAAKQIIGLGSRFLLTTSSGVYRSRSFDQGWEKIGDEGHNIFSRAYINDTLLFIADGSSVWKSVDGGVNYVDVNAATYPPLRLQGITYLGDTKLLAAGEKDGVEEVTAYSADLGANWAVRPSGVVVTSSIAYVGNGTVLLNGYNPLDSEQSSRSYAFTLFQSTNAGLSWAEMSPILGGSVLKTCPAIIDYCESCEEWILDGIIWNQVEGAGSVILAAGDLFQSSCDNRAHTCGLWKSTDGGTSWRYLASPVTSCSFIGDTPFDPIASVAIDPQGQVLMVVESGSTSFLYKSTDAGETWELVATPDGSAPFGVMYLGNHLDEDQP